jgi:hypothetical protein
MTDATAEDASGSHEQALELRREASTKIAVRIAELRYRLAGH